MVEQIGVEQKKGVAPGLAVGRLSAGQRLKAILGGASGNLVEWFDWFVFASFSIYFAPHFFPSDDRTVQLLQAAAIFALGFVVRPIGAWAIGKYADLKGRRAALTLAISLMCAGSLLIAVLPGYHVIGPVAPALLLFARLLQGFSVGGEYGASATYISEMAGRDRRGFWSTFQCVTLVSGQLLALFLLIFLQSVLPEAALNAWGWRIPFAIGAVLAVVVFWIRLGLHESQSWTKTEQTKRPSTSALSLIRHHPKATLLVFALTVVGSTGFYVFIGYMQKFLVNTSGFEKDIATRIVTVALIVFLFAQPVCGWISDHVGRKRVLIFSFGAVGIAAYPVLSALAVTQDVMTAFTLVTLLLVLYSGYSALGAVFKAELFPAHIRALGVGLPYALANAIFGGTGEFFALWFKNQGHENYFFIYLSALMFVGMVVAMFMPDSRTHSLIEDD